MLFPECFEKVHDTNLTWLLSLVGYALRTFLGLNLPGTFCSGMLCAPYFMVKKQNLEKVYEIQYNNRS